MAFNNSIAQKKLGKLSYFLALAIVITLPFGFLLKLNNLFSILLIVAWLFQFKLAMQSKLIRFFLAFYTLHVIGVFYSSDLDQAFFELEKKIGFLLFPIALLGIPRIEKKHFTIILIGFVASCFVATLVCVSNATLQYLSTASFDHFFYFPLAEIIRMHPIYLAMYTCLAVFVTVHLYFKEDFCLYRFRILLFAGIIGYFSLILFLLSARTVTVAFCIIAVVSIIVYFFRKKQLFIGVGTIAALLVFASSLIYFIPTNLERFKEAINYKSQYSIEKQYGGRSTRELIWSCSFQVIKKNILIGVGTGDAQDELLKCYQLDMDKNWALLYRPEYQYNAHSQYLQTFIDLGIVGVLAFLACLVVPAIIAIKYNDYLLLSFVILFSLACSTESMLELNKGIVFFSFFSSLFLNRYNSSEIE